MKIFITILLVSLLDPLALSFVVPSRSRNGMVRSSTLCSSGSPDDSGGAAKLLAQEETIENLQIFIEKLQKQLDEASTSSTVSEPVTAQPDAEMKLKVETLELEVKDTSSMLAKRDMLIENLEEEIVELENQLKTSGKFIEKKPPMKGRKVVGDEDDWVDPLQDVQGSLLFHFGMTIRLTLITIFYRIPRFLISLPKRFMR